MLGNLNIYIYLQTDLLQWISKWRIVPSFSLAGVEGGEYHIFYHRATESSTYRTFELNGWKCPKLQPVI